MDLFSPSCIACKQRSDEGSPHSQNACNKSEHRWVNLDSPSAKWSIIPPLTQLFVLNFTHLFFTMHSVIFHCNFSFFDQFILSLYIYCGMIVWYWDMLTKYLKCYVRKKKKWFIGYCFIEGIISFWPYDRSMYTYTCSSPEQTGPV